MKFLNINSFIKKGKKSSLGRSHGKISMRGRERGSVKKFRIIDRHRALWNVPCFVLSFNYNPKHKSCCVLVNYFIGIISLITAASNLRIGQILMSSKFVRLKAGNATFIKFIPRNIKINSIEASCATLFSISRSPGSFSLIVKKSKFYSILKLSSKVNKKVSNFCYCVIGKVSFIKYKLNIRRAAGTLRLKGFRPSVRGVAMNPIDHPHGGGVGKKSKKSSKMSPWGKIIRNLKKKNLAKYTAI